MIGCLEAYMLFLLALLGFICLLLLVVVWRSVIFFSSFGVLGQRDMDAG